MPDERRQLAELAVREVAGRVPVLMGASAISAKQTVALAEIAAAAGVDGLLLQPQSYVLKGTTAEIVARYDAVTKAVALPIVVYDSPRRTGLALDVPTIRAIADVADVVGMKASSRDFFHTTHVIEAFADRFSIMIGPAPYIFPGLALGARGFISTGPELVGPAVARITTQASAAPTPESRRMHFVITRLYQALMETGTWPAALKAALTMLGVPAGVPRDPVQPLAGDAAQRLRNTLESLGVDLAAAHTTS
jgi:4-hydroxy-tetrahydrodipicolinate synthase